MIIGNKIDLVMFTLTTFILYLQMTREFSTRLQAAVQKSLGTDAIEDNGLDFVFNFFSQIFSHQRNWHKNDKSRKL